MLVLVETFVLAGVIAGVFLPVAFAVVLPLFFSAVFPVFLVLGVFTTATFSLMICATVLAAFPVGVLAVFGKAPGRIALNGRTGLAAGLFFTGLRFFVVAGSFPGSRRTLSAYARIGFGTIRLAFRFGGCDDAVISAGCGDGILRIELGICRQQANQSHPCQKHDLLHRYFFFGYLKSG